MTASEILSRARREPLWYFENYLWIEDFLTKQLIKFQLNNVQRDFFWPSLEAQRRDTGMIRQIWLKARRMGASTVRTADMFLQTILNKNTVSRIISQDLDSAETIFTMSNLFYRMLPEEIKPPIRHSNSRVLNFDKPGKRSTPGLRSKIIIGTADNSNLGRSSNTNHVHGSEVAFWGSKAKEVMVAIEQAVSEAPGTSIVYESTALEQGGEFYTRYMEAKDNPKSKWTTIFVPWFKYNLYQLPLDDGENLRPDGEEKRLRVLYNLTDEQIKWRRMCIRDKCGNDIRIFRREYPANDEEAFLYSSGKKRFPVEFLTAIKERVKNLKPVWRGNVAHRRMSEDGGGRMRIWKSPVYGRKYLVSCDPAEGLTDECYQAIEVLDGHTLEHVGEWCGMVPVRELASNLVTIAQFFNDAIIVPEANNHGLAVIEEVISLGYNKLHYREQIDGPVGSPPTMRPGWWTDAKSKPLIENMFESMLTSGDVNINSVELLDELISYSYLDNGRTGPPSGKFSDRAMAYMIGLYVGFHRFGHSRSNRDRWDMIKPTPNRPSYIPPPNPMAEIMKMANDSDAKVHRADTPQRTPAKILYR